MPGGPLEFMRLIRVGILHPGIGASQNRSFPIQVVAEVLKVLVVFDIYMMISRYCASISSK